MLLGHHGMASELLVPMRAGDIPVPIPNTMVKPRTADGTAPETVWESRWMPASFLKMLCQRQESLKAFGLSRG